jgi:cytochrome c oxidase cbb3-type subunit III
MIIFVALSTAACAQAVPGAKPSAASPSGSGKGSKFFASSCAGCHGLDGRGGDRAPNIVEGRGPRLSDEDIFGIIEHGIPEAGMPSFHSLAESDIHSIVSYLRTLQGAEKAVGLPGDPKRGKALFFAKAGCSGCHTAEGQGGFMASDLSGYARTHSMDETRSAITNPNPNGDRTATVTTRDGEKYSGRVRNEDNFSLQLQTADGVFHFFAKSEMQGVEYSSQSLMPSNYGSTLISDDLKDLISYMMSLANRSESENSKAGSLNDKPTEEQ